MNGADMLDRYEGRLGTVMVSTQPSHFSMGPADPPEACFETTLWLELLGGTALRLSWLGLSDTAEEARSRHQQVLCRLRAGWLPPVAT